MTRILFSIVIICCFSACTTKFAKVQKSKDYEYKYKKAEEYYAAKKYNFAQLLYEDLVPFIKGTSRYEDMFYKMAYAYYHQKDYVNAENLFKNFTEYFPASVHAEECEYMRAYTFYKQSPKVELDQTNTNKAIGLLQAFINTHPASNKLKEANDLLDMCREKLELKEYKSAELYYNLGLYKAAAIAFSTVSENFPDSKKADEYKLLVIKSYYKYAEMSYEEKQQERFEKVLSEISDFKERFNESKFATEVDKFKNQTNTVLKNLKNEQTKKTLQ
jgi:outer membrane protein assembly factor BamD